MIERIGSWLGVTFVLWANNPARSRRAKFGDHSALWNLCRVYRWFLVNVRDPAKHRGRRRR
jgi:hypothetical protein